MPANKRYILGLNTDSDDITIGKTDCVLKQNLRSVTSDVDGYGRNETVLGNVLIPNPLLSNGTNISLNLPGSGYDAVNNRIFIFNWNINGNHGIYVYSFVTGLWNKVLMNNQVSGGLGFTKYNLIKAKVVGSNLYWNDRLTQPHKINIQAAIIANNSNNLVYGIVFNENRTSGVALTVTYTSTPSGTVSTNGYYRVIGTSTWILIPQVGYTSTQTVFAPFITNDILEYRFEFVGGTGNILDTVYSSIAGAYTFPLLQNDILLIVRPSLSPLSVLKVTDGTFPSNFIENEAFQFTTRYVYATWERSVIGQWSQVSLPNLPSENFNAVDIKLPFVERIPQNIAQVELIVRYGNRGDAFVIHTWENPGQEIAQHNNGTVQLSYRFYNNQTGVGIGSEEYRPFDFIPLREEDFDIARDRYFSGGGLYGYDTPKISSLTATLSAQVDPTTLAAQWQTATVYYNYNGSAVGPLVWYILYVPSLGLYYNVGTYGNPFFPIVPPNNLTINIDDSSIIVGIGTNINAAIQNNSFFNAGLGFTYATSFGTGVYENPVGTPVPVTANRVGSGTNAARALRSNSPYALSVEFLDDQGRRTGKTKEVLITTAARTFGQVAFQQTIKWMVSNAQAPIEIPLTATQYRILRSVNLKYDFFADGSAKNSRYVTKDASGVFQFTQTTYAADRNGIAIDISAIEGYGFGYVYSEGDLIEIIRPSQPIVTLSVIGQYGQWVICSLRDLGTLDNNTQILFTLYTPYRPAENEPSYEVGNAYPIIAPGTVNRTYSTLQGYINGDITTVVRNQANTVGTAVMETMSPNDKVWKVWNTDIGFANITDTIGQQWRPNQITWSNTYRDGTRTNGLSSFLLSNTKELPYEIGGIKLLSLVGKVQEEGTVMLANGRLRACSLYLGEVRITDSEDNTTVAATSEVIGTIRLLQEEAGMINPESFVQDNSGNAWWVDCVSGKVWQYANNGLAPVSEYNTRRFWRLYCKQYRSMTQAQIELLGNRSFIFGGYDPQHREVLWGLPKLLNAPPKGNLVDFSNIAFPYDTYDGQGKTMRFKNEGNIWDGHCSYVADGSFNDTATLFLFKAGSLYRGNEGSVFFGVAYTSLLSIVEPAGSDIVKKWENLRLQANKKPDFTHLRSEYPEIQSSSLVPANWRTDEGVQDASILRDRLTPGLSPYITAQFRGREMTTRAIKIHFVWNSPVIINFVNTDYEISRGHKV